MVKNPVMFVVEIGSVLTTLVLIQGLLGRADVNLLFVTQITLWLWFTVLFANFAEAMAEARGKAQADTLRRTRRDTPAKRLRRDGSIETVSSTDLRKGDVVLVEAEDLVPSDGEVIEGVAYVNEAAITGESAPVLKEPGTDIASSVTGGTQVISRLDQGRDHRQPRRDVPGPDDRAGRGRQAPADAERDRPLDPAGRPDDHLPAGGRHAPAVRDLRRRRRSRS